MSDSVSLVNGEIFDWASRSVPSMSNTTSVMAQSLSTGVEQGSAIAGLIAISSD
jgi:hypothetical protein